MAWIALALSAVLDVSAARAFVDCCFIRPVPPYLSGVTIDGALVDAGEWLALARPGR